VYQIYKWARTLKVVVDLEEEVASVVGETEEASEEEEAALVVEIEEASNQEVVEVDSTEGEEVEEEVALEVAEEVLDSEEESKP
jgi:hypothetical protein